MQKFGLQLVTPPAVEPVSLITAKSHLRVDFSNDDQYISSLITMARTHVENILNRALFNQTWLMTLDQFPYAESFRTIAPATRENFLGNGYFFSLGQVLVPLGKVSSVTSITYLDGSNTQQTLDSSAYVVDANSEPARIVPSNGGSWPYPSNYAPGSVHITFIAGTYGDGVTVNTCPLPICHAILLYVGHMYNNREAVSDRGMTNLPMAFDSLLAPYKFLGLAV